MADRILDLLKEVRDLANGFVADECPRRESEPFIDVWELASRTIRIREACSAHHEPSGDIRVVTHDTTRTLIQRLKALRKRLSARSPVEQGLHAEMRAIADGVLDCRRFA
jgi:hypothetical protein